MATEASRPSWAKWLILLLGMVPLVAQAAEGGPVRVEVESTRLEVDAGSKTPVTVKLVDAAGNPAPPTRPVEVQITLGWSDGGSKTVPVKFKTGESTREVMVEAEGAGVVSVEATNEELLKGATMLRVRPEMRLQSFTGAAAELPESVEPTSDNRRSRPGAPRPTVTLPESVHERALPESVRERTLPRPDIGPVTTAPGEESAATDGDEEDGSDAADGVQRVLELRPFPDRPLRADGVDPAKIFAFLHGPAQDSDVRLTFWWSKGQLEPTELRIPRGQLTGEAKLTSNSPGPIRVDLMNSSPELDVAGDGELQFEFHPPIDALDVAAPSTLDVGDTAELAVDLINADGTPVQTVSSRKVRFQVLAGKVRINRPEAEIAAGDSGVRTELTADWWGDAEIEVSTPNLSKQRISVMVGLPWGLLAVTALGGTLGGLIAWTHGPSRRQRLVMRLLVGLVAGLVLYWLLAYLVVPGTPDVVREVAVRNPFGAFASTVVGGWLGTEVFEIVARRLGLGQAPA